MPFYDTNDMSNSIIISLPKRIKPHVAWNFIIQYMEACHMMIMFNKFAPNLYIIPNTHYRWYHIASTYHIKHFFCLDTAFVWTSKANRHKSSVVLSSTFFYADVDIYAYIWDAYTDRLFHINFHCKIDNKNFQTFIRQ